METKIISYDSVNGKGILITEKNEKIDFSIDKWNDFEILPKIGLIVEIDNNGNLLPKKDLDKEKLVELKILIDNYINSSVANGWKVVNNSESGFVLEEKGFSFFVCIILLIVFSILFSFLMGVFAPIIALPFSIWFSITKRILKGIIIYDKFEVDIYEKDKFYKKLTIKKES